VNLSEDVTYTVISEVPYRDRTRLRLAPTNYSKSIRNYYLQIPKVSLRKGNSRNPGNFTQAPHINLRANSVFSSVLEAVLQHPLKSFSSTLLDKRRLSRGFPLFKHKGGYPDHFSTVLTVMLRSIGIPARLVAGFSPGEFNPFTGLYTSVILMPMQ